MHSTCIKINLNRTFSKFYTSSENLAIEEVIVLCKGRVIFRQYTPKKRKCFGIKIYKLYDPAGHMLRYESTWRTDNAWHSTGQQLKPSNRTEKED